MKKNTLSYELKLYSQKCIFITLLQIGVHLILLLCIIIFSVHL